jgi:aminoglycoside phosphotransferase (APT) family kinase protein
MPATLDIDVADDVVEYLRAEGRIDRDERPAIAILPGGVSCRTVRVDRPSGEGWVLKQALPRLRVEADWFSSPERIHREALTMEMLGGLVPAGSIPRLIFEDRSQDLVAMEAIAEPHDVWKQLLLEARVEDDHVRQFGVLLACIHREARARRDQFESAFADRSYFETLRLDPYYAHSGREVPAAAAFLEALMAETRDTLLTATHGDYSPKNVLVRRGRLVLLDHEVMHWGDGAFDLGFAMTHLLAKSRHVEGAGARFLAATHLFWTSYREDAGDPFDRTEYEGRVVRHTLACLLARAVGKSPLEYLGQGAKEAQAAAALSLMSAGPTTVAELVEGFDSSRAWEHAR